MSLSISPSIAAANQLNLEIEVRRVEAAHCTDLHIDIEDGNFVPNITFGMKTVKALRRQTKLPFSFHLMVTRPMDYLPDIFGLHPSIVFAHIEALDYASEYIHVVKNSGTKVGLAFNPKTPIDPFKYAIENADGVLIMTSEPDGQGQQFIHLMLEKVLHITELGLPLQIWLDGGIKPDQLSSLGNLGVTHAVLGRTFFEGDYERAT